MSADVTLFEARLVRSTEVGAVRLKPTLPLRANRKLCCSREGGKLALAGQRRLQSSELQAGERGCQNKKSRTLRGKPCPYETVWNNVNHATFFTDKRAPGPPPRGLMSIWPVAPPSNKPFPLGANPLTFATL